MDSYVKRHNKALEAQAARAAANHHGKITGMYLTSVIDRLAAEDALFTGDDGTPVVWLHRMVRANGKRRMFGSMLHGSMGNGLCTGLGLQRCQPGRQVIALVGDGGLAMMFGDLLTTIQEDLPIKIAVFDNGKLGFVEIEQKAEGMLDTFTKLKNPNFAGVADRKSVV